MWGREGRAGFCGLLTVSKSLFLFQDQEWVRDGHPGALRVHVGVREMVQ